MKIECITVFGDSTSWGAWDMEKGGWASRLWFDFAKRKENFVWLYNQSIPGGTSETILSRFESEAKIREADLLIFQTGGNDASRRGPERVQLVSPEKFRANIEEIIVRARKITSHIIFLGFKKIDESKTQPVSWADIHYLNADLQAYNQITQDTCAREGILFIDMWDVLTVDDFEDGIHPNAAGHQKMFVKIRNFLVEHKFI